MMLDAYDIPGRRSQRKNSVNISAEGGRGGPLDVTPGKALKDPDVQRNPGPELQPGAAAQGTAGLGPGEGRGH